MYLLKLPFSTILTTLAVVSTAVGVELRQLTPANFTELTTNGLWFIEHYSPYCGHCRRFEPTWEELVGDCEQELPSVQLAQVNCAAYGDLCEANKIRGYPSILFYEDGNMLEEYKGNRDLDDLKQFLQRHVKAKDESKVSVAEVEEEPQPVLNPDGQVLSIPDPETFASTLEKGLAFIEFLAPWCGHCKALAPTWARLAAELKGKVTVAEVDCTTQRSICSVQDIQAYPTLIYYAKGTRSQYAGKRKLDQLKAFVDKNVSGGLRRISSSTNPSSDTSQIVMGAPGGPSS